MIIIDAQLSPHLAKWLNERFGVVAFSLSFLGLRDASDLEIYEYAKEVNGIVLTKDDDFVDLINRLGSPPKMIWITCGNTSSTEMKKILEKGFLKALELLKNNNIVEFSD